MIPVPPTPDILLRRSSEVVQIVKLPDITERLNAQGVEPVANTPAEFVAFIQSEITRWGRVVKVARL